MGVYNVVDFDGLKVGVVLWEGILIKLDTLTLGWATRRWEYQGEKCSCFDAVGTGTDGKRYDIWWVVFAGKTGDNFETDCDYRFPHITPFIEERPKECNKAYKYGDHYTESSEKRLPTYLEMFSDTRGGKS